MKNTPPARQHHRVKPPTQSSRRRSSYHPQRRREVAIVRKIGACPDCRRRKVRCLHALEVLNDNIAAAKLSVENGLSNTQSNTSTIHRASVPNPDENNTSDPLIDYGEGNAFPRHLGNSNDIRQQGSMEHLNHTSPTMQHSVSQNSPNSTCVSDLRHLGSLENPMNWENESLSLPHDSHLTSPLSWAPSTESYQRNIFEAGYDMSLSQPSNYFDSATDEYNPVLDTLSSPNPDMLPFHDPYRLDEGSTNFHTDENLIAQQEGDLYQTQSFSVADGPQNRPYHDFSDLMFPSNANDGY